MSRVRGSLNVTISGKTDQVSCVFGANQVCLGQNGFLDQVCLDHWNRFLDQRIFSAQRIRCVYGKTAFSVIHELCESF